MKTEKKKIERHARAYSLSYSRAKLQQLSSSLFSAALRGRGLETARVGMAQWIRRVTTDHEILGSNPSIDFFLLFFARTSPRAPLRAAPRRRAWCFRRLLSFWAGGAPKRTSGSAELGDDARCDSLLLRTVSLFYATKTGTDLVCEFLASSSSRVAQRFDSFGPAAEEESFVRRGTRAFARIQCKSASLGDGDVPAWSAGTMGV